MKVDVDSLAKRLDMKDSKLGKNIKSPNTVEYKLPKPIKI